MRETVEARDIGFYIDERRSVQHVNAENNKPVPGPFVKTDHGKTDAVRARRMAARKDPVRLIIEECGAYQFPRCRPVKNIDEEEMRKKLNVLEPFFKFRKTSTSPLASGRNIPWMGASSFIANGE